MTLSQQAPSLVERQEFEKFPKLAGWIEKLATRKIEGFSLASWCAFLSEINAAIRERSPAQGPAADVIRRLRTPDEFNNRGPDYEPMIIQPSALRLEAADALEEAAARITELEGEVQAGIREILALRADAERASPAEPSGWRPIDQAPDLGRKIVALYGDGSGASMFWRHDGGYISADGDEWGELPDHYALWTYLPDSFQFWCEYRSDEPMTLTLPPTSEGGGA